MDKLLQNRLDFSNVGYIKDELKLIDNQIKDLTFKPFVRVRRLKTFKETNKMLKTNFEV
jgi:hypothetical protein